MLIVIINSDMQVFLDVSFKMTRITLDYLDHLVQMIPKLNGITIKMVKELSSVFSL